MTREAQRQLFEAFRIAFVAAIFYLLGKGAQ